MERSKHRCDSDFKRRVADLPSKSPRTENIGMLAPIKPENRRTQQTFLSQRGLLHNVDIERWYCHECGAIFDDAQDLQMHMIRKTAWSNLSLVGCQVSCFIDDTKWYKATVIHYHRSSKKHYVVLNETGECRWLNMLKTAFYICQRAKVNNSTPDTTPRLPHSGRLREEQLTRPGSPSQEHEASSHYDKVDKKKKMRNKSIPPLYENSSRANYNSGGARVRDSSPRSREKTRQAYSGSEETKEPHVSTIEPGLAPIEPWTYSENISVSFCRAQSMIHKIYGGGIQATGHKTLGHSCVTDKDKIMAKNARSSLLYGELLPRGVNRSFGSQALNAIDAEVLFDLGMGTGKVAIQAFLQYSNLSRVYGVEISVGRFRVAERAALNLVALWPEQFVVEAHECDNYITICTIDSSTANATKCHGFENTGGRRLELVVGDMMKTVDIESADIVMIETEIPVEVLKEFVNILLRTKDSCRLFTYVDLRIVWQRLRSDVLRNGLLTDHASQQLGNSRGRQQSNPSAIPSSSSEKKFSPLPPTSFSRSSPQHFRIGADGHRLQVTPPYASRPAPTSRYRSLSMWSAFSRIRRAFRWRPRNADEPSGAELPRSIVWLARTTEP